METPDLFQPSDEYLVRETPVPPVLKEIDGKWFIETYAGNLTLRAPIGFNLMRQIFERVVIPAIVKVEERQG